jgi:pilus assembly protein Flp/PilA
MYLYLYLKNWLAEQEEGQDLVEYALLIGLVSIAAIAILTTLGPKIAEQFSSVQDALP